MLRRSNTNFRILRDEKHVKIGTDYTQKLEEGMLVPVFYDRENPNRQVPACGTFHEVILQEQSPPSKWLNFAESLRCAQGSTEQARHNFRKTRRRAKADAI